MNLTRAEKERKLALLREKRIRESRRSFWTFCKTLAPGFYLEDRWHLKLLCHVLQALYERRLTIDFYLKLVDDIAPDYFKYMVDYGSYEHGKIYHKLMLNQPPRHGKSRTLVNFVTWCFGKDKSERVITCSYNDTQAQDFSRYTRDGIMIEKNLPHQIVYSDIFPETQIKRGNAAYGKWALDGEFFSYLGSGIGGGITGKGYTISIIDDPVKDAEEALNEGRLDTIWQWYAGTFLSRGEETDGKQPIDIINMTRWAKKDICGRWITGEGFGEGWSQSLANEWFVFKLEACYDDVMVCPSLLSREKYELLSKVMVPEIFEANYHQSPVDIKGRLYKELKTYSELPEQFEGIFAYIDTADQGEDYLAGGVYGVYQKEAYLLDVIYTKDGMEITEPQTADFLVRNDVNRADIESNNGGRGFARNVEKEILSKYNTKKVVISWFHQSQNKKARILTQSNWVMSHLYLPKNWRDRWPEFSRDILSYQKEGKNKHDDGPDMLTGIAEKVNGYAPLDVW